MRVSDKTGGFDIKRPTPAGILSLRKAIGKGRRVYITIVCIAWARRFTDDNLVERNAGRCDFKDGALGPGGRRGPEETVAGGILAATL